MKNCNRHAEYQRECPDCIPPKPKSALDTQVAGNHYKKLKIQPMEYSMANDLNACQHTIIKYVTRYKDKGGIQDLEKAKHCIDMLIEFEKNKNTEQGKNQDSAVSMIVFAEDSENQKKYLTFMRTGQSFAIPGYDHAWIVESMKDNKFSLRAVTYGC